MVDRYFADGEERALALGNRGPIRFDAEGRIHPDIIDAYWRHGFYVFEGILDASETKALVDDFESVLAQAPTGTRATTDRQGRPAIGLGFTKPSFRFVKPLSDPNGGTDSTHGRYPAKMSEPALPCDAPAEVIYQLKGVFHLMESAFQLYGHPQLLAVEIGRAHV